jgi:hypothetical protein
MKMSQEQIEKIDYLIIVVDHWATESAHIKKHIDSAYKLVIQQYAKITGITQKEARSHLDTLIR